ncbi:hypothetical protein [Abyssibacter sp.]|jgi:hypothetical protein|uniref:hypothetical protein n=1 Tax=Abyssibacter sp. TaxID=2320200 RepID=UPI0025C0A660|nr:hypothetical protein [Abyssibacter sp.]MCK5858886.1 hypothetical protein [Abyssibacter sp.]
MFVDPIAILAWAVVAATAVFALLGMVIPAAFDWRSNHAAAPFRVGPFSSELNDVIDADLHAGTVAD